jgi:cytochrome P450
MKAPGRSGSVVPGPKGSLLLGMARELQRDQLGTYESAMSEYGDVVRLSFGPPGLRSHMYLVTHPEGVRQVLTGGLDEYTKETPFYREIAAYLGNGLLTSDGAVWRQQRRTLAPLFTPRRTAEHVEVMAEEAVRLAERWAPGSAPYTEVELHAEMTDYTLRTVGRILFGANVDQVVPVIQRAFPVVSEHIRRRAIAPLPLPRHWRTPAQRRAAAAQRTLYDVVDRIIEERRRAEGEGRDMISLLLAARDPETGTPLSPQEVRDQVMIFLLAGYETSTTALTFTYYLLGRHPEAQERVHEEAVAVLGAKAAPDGDDLQKLTYTTMVVKEAMRLYPPGYILGRFVPDGDTIGGHRIPPGSVVALSPWATHRNPEFWPEPHRFVPERFEADAVTARHRYAYFPFAGGPRGCIGIHFGLAEAVVATATVLATCALRSDAEQIPLSTDITLSPAGPVRCEVTRRRPGGGPAAEVTDPIPG